MKHFILFLVWTWLGSTYAAALALWRAVQCFRGKWDCTRTPSADLILMGASTVLAIFFSIFVVTMMCDQWEGAVTNTTQVESMKRWREEQRSLLRGLEDVFGEPPSLAWLLPTPLKNRYAWSPLDDPDFWDKRNPDIISHFEQLHQTLKGRELPAPLPAPKGVPLIPQLRARYLELVGEPGHADAAKQGGGDGGGSEQKADGGAKGSLRRRRQ
jgi:hypothetical protein